MPTITLLLTEQYWLPSLSLDTVIFLCSSWKVHRYWGWLSVTVSSYIKKFQCKTYQSLCIWYQNTKYCVFAMNSRIITRKASVFTSSVCALLVFVYSSVVQRWERGFWDRLVWLWWQNRIWWKHSDDKLLGRNSFSLKESYAQCANRSS